nr:Flp1 family type IVb pilin [Paenibacillus sp. JJ-100]
MDLRSNATEGMKSKISSLWKEEDGLGTLESILIIGVIIIIALIFKNQIKTLVENLLKSVSSKSNEFFE